MAAFGFSDDYTNILPGGVDTWKIKSGKSGEVGYVSMGELSDTSLEATTMSVSTSRLYQRPFSIGIAAQTRMLGTAKTTCLQKLNLLTGYLNYHSIKTIGGKYITGQLGTRWRFVCEGDYDTNRYIELMADIVIPASSWDTYYASVEETASDPADYLYGFAPGDPVPAGFSAVQTRNAGETSWETLGSFANASLVAEYMPNTDSRKRSVRGASVVVNIGFDMAQTDEEVPLLDTFAAGKPDFKITLADGAIFTFADNMGVDWKLSHGAVINDNPSIRVTGTGGMTPAAFVACIS